MNSAIFVFLLLGIFVSLSIQEEDATSSTVGDDPTERRLITSSKRVVMPAHHGTGHPGVPLGYHQGSGFGTCGGSYSQPWNMPYGVPAHPSAMGGAWNTMPTPSPWHGAYRGGMRYPNTGVRYGYSGYSGYPGYGQSYGHGYGGHGFGEHGYGFGSGFGPGYTHGYGSGLVPNVLSNLPGQGKTSSEGTSDE